MTSTLFRESCIVLAASLALSGADAQAWTYAARPEVVNAGGYYTVEYTVTVGTGGISRGGGVRIEIPVAYAETEFLLWSAPQTESSTFPGYVSATTSNKAPVNVRIDGLLRGIVQADLERDVPPGTAVTISYRGQVQGIAGQIDARFETRTRPSDTWLTAPESPRITVRPARAQYVSLHYPSDIVRREPFAMSVVAFDRFGNVATDHAGTLALQSTDSAAAFPKTVTFTAANEGRVIVPNLQFRTTGFQKITAVDESKRLTTTFKYAMVSDTAPAYKHLFGDTHFHTGTGADNKGFFTNSSGADVNTTGTNTFKALNLAGDHRANFTRAGLAYAYARDAMGLDFANTAEHSAPLLTQETWSKSQDVSDAFYVPDKFTTFYGFEWTPDLDHYVVLYRSRQGKPFGHDRYPDFPSLARALESQRQPVLAIPHVSWPFAQHNIWQDTSVNRYRRVGEIYSLWNSRHLVQPDDDPQLFELPDDRPWSYQYAWKRGHRIGVIASSDNHLGHPGANNNTIYVRHSGGLAVVLARSNNRENIWQGLVERATYATTGSQIYVDFSADGHQMGSEYRTRTAPRLTARIAGTNRLAVVEIVKLEGGAYSTVFSARPTGETFTLDFVDTTFTAPSMYYLRVRQVEEYPDRLYGHSTAEMAWSSPIWIDRE